MLIPTLGFALGLGDINLRSGLNQQLNADIELLSVDPDDIGRVSVSLANAETFAKLGVDRPIILQDLKFEVLKNSNGVPYIKVKSTNLINEPFLDFLVEVTWPNGKVLREYTLLLEPPEMARQEPLMLDTPQTYEQPVITEAPRPVQEPASVVPEPLVSAPVDMPAEQQPAAAQGESTETASSAEPGAEVAGAAETAAEPEQTTGRFPVDGGAAAAAAPSAPASEALVYGPVQRNEYLYRIAKRMRPDESISVEQMMIALFNANRKAFIRNNINLLRKGAVLRIEDPAVLRALSHAEARREVARHGRAWEEYRRQVAAKTPESAPTADSKEPAKTGAVAAAVKDEPKLSLVAPDKKGAAAKGSMSGTDAKAAETDSLRKELMLATETAQARRQENEELNKRLKELEGQQQDIQKLLTLKSDEMAALQKQKEAQQAAAAQADKAAPAPVTPEKSAVEPPVEAPAQPTVAQPVTEEGAPAPAEAESKPPVSSSEATPPTSAEQGAANGTTTPAAPDVATTETPKTEVAQAPAPKDKPKPKPVAPKKPRPVTPPPEPSFFEQLLNDPVMLGGGIAGIVILVLAVLMLIRKRRQGRGFQESILTVGATSSMMKGKGDNPASETSFLSDLAISGMGGRVHEEGDVDDPLTEADVYLTYNKFQTAEDLLKEALIHTPERDELHAKLLEVYYRSNNKEAFEQHAAERAASLQKNDTIWQKVMAWGSELVPDNPLFVGVITAGAGAAVAAAATAHEAPALASNEVFDIGLDLDALSSEMEAAGPSDSDFNVDLGLDFSDFGNEESSVASAVEESHAEPEVTESFLDLDLGETPAEETVEEEVPSLDFDLGSFASESEFSEPVASEPVQAEESLLGDMDFDLSAFAEEAPAEEESAVSLDFGDLDLGTVAEEPQQSESDTSLDFGSLDFGSSDELSTPSEGESIDFGDFDLGASTEETPTMDLSDFGELGDFGDLGDDASFEGMDEVGTKLDLAKAYVDMGDSDGARGMLEEVMQEGSDEQKQQAKELLAQIA